MAVLSQSYLNIYLDNKVCLWIWPTLPNSTSTAEFPHLRHHPDFHYHATKAKVNKVAKHTNRSSLNTLLAMEGLGPGPGPGSGAWCYHRTSGLRTAFSPLPDKHPRCTVTATTSAAADYERCRCIDSWSTYVLGGRRIIGGMLTLSWQAVQSIQDSRGSLAWNFISAATNICLTLGVHRNHP